MKTLVMKDSPLLVLPKLAERIGLNEAIFIQQLHYWLERSKHVHDGHRWVYNTYDGWKEQFPFWSHTTIRRIVGKLEKSGLIITGNYNIHKSDKTKWYRVNYELVDCLFEEQLDTFTAHDEQSNETDEATDFPALTDQHDQQLEPNRTVSKTNMDRALPETTTEITPEKKDVVVVNAREGDWTSNICGTSDFRLSG